MNDLTRQERIDRAKEKISELGILDICDVNSLEGIESAIEIIEKHNKEYPPEFVAMENDFIIKNRENVWKCHKTIQHIYFYLLHKVSFQLKNEGFNNDNILIFLEKTFNGKYFNEEVEFASRLEGIKDIGHIHCPQCGLPIYRKDFDEVPDEIADLLSKVYQ